MKLPWQGNPWKPCPASALEYVGVAPREEKPLTVNLNNLEEGMTPDQAILRGIEPRPPRPQEYEDMPESLHGLKKHCWWLTDDSGSNYNCFGWVIALEGIQKGEGITAPEPANMDYLGPGDKYDLFFGLYDYTRIPEPARAKVPPAARIAWFSGLHVALRSDYRYEGEDLWESKLGLFPYRILHPLRAVESKEYGKVKRWYRKT